MVGRSVGAFIENCIAIVSQRFVTSINAYNCSSIGGNQGLNFVFSTVVIRQSFADISSTVVSFQSRWAFQLGLSVKIGIVSFMSTLTLE
jgi:hypothetical protein